VGTVLQTTVGIVLQKNSGYCFSIFFKGKQQCIQHENVPHETAKVIWTRRSYANNTGENIETTVLLGNEPFLLCSAKNNRNNKSMLPLSRATAGTVGNSTWQQ
jgi:hypothetical protein